MLEYGIYCYNQEKYDAAILACSEAIALKGDLEKAYLYRKASLDALSSIERKKCLGYIVVTTCNFQLCGLTDSDLDAIIPYLNNKKGVSIVLNLCHNLITEKFLKELLVLVLVNPYVTQIKYEIDNNPVLQKIQTFLQENRNWYYTAKEKRLNECFFVFYRLGKMNYEYGDIHKTIRDIMSALNRELHNPLGIESLITAMHKQQSTYQLHQNAITGMFLLHKKTYLIASLDNLCIGNLEDMSPIRPDWEKSNYQGVTALLRLNETSCVTGYRNSTLVVIDTKKTPQIFQKYHSQAISSLLRLSDDTFISYDGSTLMFWDMKQEDGLLVNLIGSNKCVKTVTEKGATAPEVLSSNTIIFASKNILKLFDTKKYTVTEEIDTKYSKSSITKIKQLREGKLVIGYGDGYIQIFDSMTKNFTPIKVVSHPQSSITSFALLNDMYWLSASQDGQVKVWDVTNNCVSRFDANSAATSLCVGSLGQVYISCEDGTLHRWQPSLKINVPVNDDSLLKPYKIAGDLITKTKDEEGQYQELGRGGFGVVYRGLYNGKVVAIKEIVKKNKSKEEVDTNEKDLINEMKLMAQMHQYPTLLSLEGVVMEKDRLQLVMELMSQGSLSSFLSNAPDIAWEDRWLLMMDIVYGVLCLHSNNIVHRDIKPENILINNNRARISDFGTARKNNTTKQTSKIGWTLRYKDPWLVSSEGENERFTEKSDIYSLGNVLWVMLNEKYQEPWQDIQSIEEYKKRLVDNNEKLKIPEKTPASLKIFLPTSWEKKRNKRPNIATVFEKITKSQAEFQKYDSDFLSKTFSKKGNAETTVSKYRYR